MFSFKNISILPVMVFIALLAFSFRLVDVYSGVSEMTGAAQAATEKKDEPKEGEPAEKEEHAADKADDHAEEKAMSKAPEIEKKTVWRDANDEDFGFNSVKMEHIQGLDKRRQELDKREGTIQSREALVKAAQQEMSRKFVELNQLRGQLEELLDKQVQEDDAQITSLVKIYEGMKAKEAAGIFNTLDLNVLLDVIGRMSERKAAPILAKMNPERAKTVTIMLAERKKLPSLPMQ